MPPGVVRSSQSGVRPIPHARQRSVPPPPPPAIARDFKELRVQLLQAQREGTGLRAERDRLRLQLRQRDDQLAELRRELAQRADELTAVHAALAQAQQRAERPVDDLRRIQGIGPAFERALHAAGVRRFEQIAAWTQADVHAMAERIKTRPGRILSNGWVEAAQRLASEKTDR